MTAGRLLSRAAAAVLGLAFILCVVAGRADLLVRPWFEAVLVGTGIVILIVAAADMPQIERGAAFMLLLPVAVALSVTPTIAGKVKGGSEDISNLGARIGDPSNPLVHGRGGDVDLLQIRLAESKVGAVYLAGRPVTVEARVSGRHEIARLAIVCCAADARLVTLPTRGAALPKNGTWVRISGRLAAVSTSTVLQAQHVERISTPGSPFL